MSMTSIKESRVRRSSAGYRNSEIIRRVLWSFTAPVFLLSPRLLYGWRNGLLRLFGASVGRKVQIYPTVRIFAPWHLVVGDGSTIGDRAIIYNVGKITIGDLVTISQNAHVCAGSHDYAESGMKLLRLPITVGDNVWICADSFLGPGVTIGQDAVIGARSAVFREVAAGTVVGGNPATFLKFRAPELQAGEPRG